MGQWDIPILIGAAAIGGWFIISNPDLLTGILGTHPDGPPSEDGGKEEEEPKEIPTELEEEGGGGGGEDGGGDGSGDGTYDCKKACRNCWCKSYSENCSGSCSKCCGANRIASKCNGEGVKSCKNSFRAYTHHQRLGFSNAYS